VRGVVKKSGFLHTNEIAKKQKKQRIYHHRRWQTEDEKENCTRGWEQGKPAGELERGERG